MPQPNWYVRKQQAGEEITQADRDRFAAEFQASGRRAYAAKIADAISLLRSAGYTVLAPGQSSPRPRIRG